ncbi:MAG TPA: CheR family methyltransferase, partial [Pusillimonas sp.]
YLGKYFQRGTGRRTGMVRVKSVLRDMIEFDTLNLLAPNWPITGKLDAIFCRNTMIYFDRATQTRILERFAAVLKPGGLLFAGHSENFTYLTKAFRLQGQTVYVAA